MTQKSRNTPGQSVSETERLFGGPPEYKYQRTNLYPWTTPAPSYEFFESSDRPWQENNCYHVKRRFFGRDAAEHRVTQIGPKNYTMYGNVNYQYVDSVPGAAPPKNGVNQFVLRGVQSIKPKFKADLSVPNFLFELKDLRRLLPERRTIESISRSLSAFAMNPFTRKGQKHAAHLLKETPNGVASQYLNANFGYLPLIDDAFNLVSSIQQFNQRLETFRRNAGRVQKGHYSEMSASIDVENSPYRNDVLKYWTRTQVDPAKYVLVLKYGYNISLPKLAVPSALLKAKYLGFRGNPRILWDAIPFSFVIDWMLRFGKALESFDEGAIPISMSIQSATVSCKYRATVTHYATEVPNGTYELDWHDVPTGTFLYDVYSRQVMNLSSSLFSGLPPLPVFDGLSQKEVTLGVALGKVLTAKR